MKNHNLRLELTTPDEEDIPVFLAGNFNDWNSNDKSYQSSRELIKFNQKNSLDLIPIHWFA